MYELKHKTKGLVSHGTTACAGCGLELIMRKVIDVVGEDTIIVIPPGCSALFSGFGKETNLKIAGVQMNLENTAACCSGIRAALDVQGNTHTTVLGFAGDGGTLDIGLQALSGAFERGDRIMYVCYDNEAYMNTGIQGSSATPYGASTTTTPGGKRQRKKDLMMIAIAHKIPYAATASLQNLNDFKRKLEKAKNAPGPSLIHVHTPCPTGWRFNPALSIEIARAAVKTGSWILYEYENGRIKVNSKLKELAPLETYIGKQGRFKKLTEKEREFMQKEIEENYYAYTSMLERMSIE
ncbi:MAG: thiamine pyrophosphate-dependent enzyme [Christensenellales bacterium]|jgi:pyruvate ferredoxin oxidoreductase beta subunit